MIIHLLTKIHFSVGQASTNFKRVQTRPHFSWITLCLKVNNSNNSSLTMGLFSTINNLLQSLVSLSLFLILFLPIYLYRLVVILIAKLHLPSGSEIIDLRSAMFSPWVSALTPMGGLIAPYIFRGSVNSSILLDYFSTQIAKHSRLSSLPILYGLYTFWVPIPKKDFKLNNHILEVVSISEDKFATKPVNPAFSKNLKNGGISQSQFDTFKKLLLSQPFPKGQSPWLVYLIKNLEHDSHGRVDVVIFKWHHGLGDGLSVFKMLGEAAQPPTIPPEISFRPPTKLQEIFLSIKSLFCLLETRWPTFSKEFCNQTSIISPNASSLKKDFFLAESESLPIEWIKKIKNKNKVGFNTVVLTALSLALRSYVTEQNKLNNEKKNDKPLDVATCIVLPYPGHPDANLTNHW